MIDETRFRRLLRWYPRSWRDSNGAVLLSTMLDSAEQDGRAKPTAADVAFAVVHGTAARLDRRFSIVTAIAAVVCAAFAGVLSAWGSAITALPLLLSGVIPLLTAWALVAVLRERGHLGDGRALATMGATVIALTLNALTVASWALGFDAADAGVPATGLAAAWLPLVIASELAGATTIGLVVDSLLRRTSIPRGARVSVAAGVGLIAAPIIGLSLLSPVVSPLLALGVAALALVPRRPAGQMRAPGPAIASDATMAEPSPKLVDRYGYRRTARTLAWIAVAGSVTGVIYALTGAQWSAGAADGTVAMGQGISLLLISAVPLLAGVGLAAAASSRVRLVHLWAPITLVVLGLGSIGVAYLNATSWGGMSPWFQVASVLVGGAIAWWIISRPRLPRAATVIIGVGAGVLYAAFVGMMIAPMLAFAVPIGATVLALQRTRPKVASRPGRPQSAMAR